MNIKHLIRTLTSIRETMDEDTDDAAIELDRLIEELENEDDEALSEDEDDDFDRDPDVDDIPQDNDD